jgi:hypothetical protein
MIDPSPSARVDAGIRCSVPAVFVALALFVGPVRAQDALKNPDTTAKTAGTARAIQSVAGVSADEKKAPDAPAALTPIVRDPFWPPGFDPNPPVVASTAPRIESAPTPGQPPVRLPDPSPADWAAAARQIKPVVGRSVDPEGQEVYFALLNNRLLAIGQTVSASTSQFTCSWRVGRITAAGVELIPAEARRLGDNKRFPPPPRDTE